MNVARSFASILATLALLGACTGRLAPTPPPASPPPTADPTTAPTVAPTTAPTATAAAVVATRDIVYQSGDPQLADGLLDVYAPAKPGSYPVVVMLHGGPGVIFKDWSEPWATKIAERGYVVFAPAWGKTGAAARSLTMDQRISLLYRQAACSVAYARSHAAEYGGDPSTLVVFGHSAGANASSVIAFGGADPADGCPAGNQVGPISSLVTYEGDWFFMDTMWGASIPKEAAAGTPWKWLSSDTRLPVLMLVSEGFGGLVEPPALDPPVDWKTARDAPPCASGC